MIEFGKIFCDLHPSELVSNYCNHEQCNVGLCATCICSHTEGHIQRGTVPDYENIRTTYSRIQEQLRSRISAFENQKSRINLQIETIHATRRKITETVATARHHMLDQINSFYDAKEKELLRRIEAEEKKLGLHNQNRMDTLLNLISRDINGLFGAAQDLNSQNFLDSFTRIRTQVLANSLQTHREISEELDKNENHEAILNYHPALPELKAALEKTLALGWEGKNQHHSKVTTSDCRDDNTASRSSRVMVAPHLEHSRVVERQQTPVTPVRRTDSVPKNQNTINRSASAVLEPYFVSKRPTFQMQPQMHQHMHQSQLHQSQLHQSQMQQPQLHQSHIQQPQLQQQWPAIQGSTLRPQGQCVVMSKVANNGLAQSCRVDTRLNSSQKTIKQNSRNPLAQSYLDTSIRSPAEVARSNPANPPQLSRKVRRSGLTVLRAVDNEKTG